jgi:serine protease Do
MKVPVKVIRDGHEKDLTVTIGEQWIRRRSRKPKPVKRTMLAGVAVQDLDRETAWNWVSRARRRSRGDWRRAESGAEKAGLMAGDVIREINRQPVKSVKEFEKASSAIKKGDNVLILINRHGNALFLTAKV